MPVRGERIVPAAPGSFVPGSGVNWAVQGYVLRLDDRDAGNAVQFRMTNGAAQVQVTTASGNAGSWYTLPVASGQPISSVD